MLGTAQMKYFLNGNGALGAEFSLSSLKSCQTETHFENIKNKKICSQSSMEIVQIIIFYIGKVPLQHD